MAPADRRASGWNEAEALAADLVGIERPTIPVVVLENDVWIAAICLQHELDS